MSFKRKIYDKLLKWKNESNGKAPFWSKVPDVSAKVP